MSKASSHPRSSRTSRTSRGSLSLAAARPALTASLLLACGCAGGLLLTSACTTTKGEVVSAIPPEPLDDAEYAPSLERWSRKVQLVDQFQKRVDASAVLFSDGMRKAYVARWSRIRGEKEAEIEGLAGGKLAVFVSIYTPEDDYLELENRQLWSHALQLGPAAVSPTLVRRLPAKSAFTPFFPFVNKWTSDYLLLFDASTAGLGAEGLVNSTSATFTMRSALASVEFTWR
jgi:hypothetical protein